MKRTHEEIAQVRISMGSGAGEYASKGVTTRDLLDTIDALKARIDAGMALAEKWEPINGGKFSDQLYTALSEPAAESERKQT